MSIKYIIFDMYELNKHLIKKMVKLGAIEYNLLMKSHASEVLLKIYQRCAIR